ncbi:MAG: hypothetical protein R3F26_04325 [Gammaproteobacteria bacterium]
MTETVSQTRHSLLNGREFIDQQIADARTRCSVFSAGARPAAPPNNYWHKLMSGIRL